MYWCLQLQDLNFIQAFAPLTFKMRKRCAVVVNMNNLVMFQQAIEEYGKANRSSQLTIILELKRFDASPLIKFTVTKETDCGAETNEHLHQH